MASEVRDMPYAEATYGASNLGGDCAGVARALGAYAERIVDPEEIRLALLRARRVTESGKPALLVAFVGVTYVVLMKTPSPTFQTSSEEPRFAFLAIDCAEIIRVSSSTRALVVSSSAYCRMSLSLSLNRWLVR